MKIKDLGISFVIKTNGARDNCLLNLLDSIKKQNIPKDKYEIMVVGITNLKKDFKYLLAGDDAKAGFLGKMNNLATDNAKFPILCLIDDDSYMEEGWWEIVGEIPADGWDLTPTHVWLVSQKHRSWDWADRRNAANPVVKDWDESADEYTYIGGGCLMVKTNVAKRVGWRKGYHEDYPFSQECFNSGYSLKTFPEMLQTKILHFWDSRGRRNDVHEKPRILLVADSPNWAFDFRCQALIKHLNPWYDFTKIYQREIPNVDSKKFDLAYLNGFYMITDSVMGRFKKERIVTSVPGLINLTIDDAIPYVNNSVAFSVLNARLLDDFVGKVNSEPFLIPNGVDAELFKPMPHEPNEVFTIGWAGQHHHKGKRLEELMSVVKNIPRVKLLIQAKDKFIPHDEMPKFYNKLDCYCCVSVSEGSNNPLSEAMACGLPVISTPVGIANEIVPYGGGLTIRENLQDLTSKILIMRDYTAERRKAMGEVARQRILSGWTWKHMTGRYKEVFDYALNKQ